MSRFAPLHGGAATVARHLLLGTSADILKSKMPTYAATVDDIVLNSDDVRLIGLPAEEAAKRVLPGSADEILKTISSMLREIVGGVVSSRTADEFRKRFRASFPTYFDLVMAFGKVASVAVNRDTLVRMVSESFSELEADIRERGTSTFGEQMTERAMFTVWTLRKIADLIDQLQRSTVDEAAREHNRALQDEYFLHAMIARFHVDCLLTFMHTPRVPFYPDVEPVIDNGLRSAVNAYACLKEVFDRQFPSDEEEPLNLPWSSEQQDLLDDSVQDVDANENENW
jgi:hypothetical protein